MPIFRKDGKNILFIHIPKTGGSTIEKVFRDSGYDTTYLDGKMGAGTINNLRRCSPQHMHAPMLRQNFRLNRFDLVFMIVRDPIARFRSEYLWRNRDGHVDPGAEAVERWTEESFRAFAKDSYLWDNHFRPQADFYLPGAEVYRFEGGLDTVVADLNERFGLALSAHLATVREARVHTGFSSSEVIVSERTNSLIREFYRRDFERFGYAHTSRSLRAVLADSAVRRALGRVWRKVRHRPRGAVAIVGRGRD